MYEHMETPVHLRANNAVLGRFGRGNISLSRSLSNLIHCCIL